MSNREEAEKIIKLMQTVQGAEWHSPWVEGVATIITKALDEKDKQYSRYKMLDHESYQKLLKEKDKDFDKAGDGTETTIKRFSTTLQRLRVTLKESEAKLTTATKLIEEAEDALRMEKSMRKNDYRLKATDEALTKIKEWRGE